MIEYATEIRKQLNLMGWQVVGSWGACEWLCGGEYVPIRNERKFSARAWLRFKVNGRIFKGLVYVVLTGRDDYTIVLVKPHRRTKLRGAWDEIVSVTEGIYCDELAEKVDRLVETPEKFREDL